MFESELGVAWTFDTAKGGKLLVQCDLLVRSDGTRRRYECAGRNDLGETKRALVKGSCWSSRSGQLG